MYESFFGFRERPFSLLPDPSFLYLSDKHRMALTLLEYGLINQAGFSVITGGIGTGKTTLIRHLLNMMGRDVTVGLITNTHRSFGELLQWILMAYNLEHVGKDKVALYQTFVDFMIKEYTRKKRTILIVDEAQNMAPSTLEELRMLSNINADKHQVLQVILVGQSGLRDLLRRPDLEQFAQRIAVDYHLKPLSREETHNYIRHRLQAAGGKPDLFEAGACDLIHEHSGGTPRLINTLCDTCLVYGFAEQSDTISTALAEDVARDKVQGGLFPSRKRDKVVNREQDDSMAGMDDVVSSAPTKQTAPLAASGSTAAEPYTTTSKPALRVAIASDSGIQRNHLRTMLKRNGFRVITTVSLAEEDLARIPRDEVDVLLVDLDENVEQELEFLDSALEHLELPIIFNDSSATRLSLTRRDIEFERKLIEKLISMVDINEDLPEAGDEDIEQELNRRLGY